LLAIIVNPTTDTVNKKCYISRRLRDKTLLRWTESLQCVKETHIKGGDCD